MNHHYVNQLSNPLKNIISQISNHPMWNTMLQEDNYDIVLPIHEMDEIYYSNINLNLQKDVHRLYGQRASIDIHRDFPISFPYAKCYRVLLCLQGNENDSVSTEFPFHHKNIFLKQNEFCVFDYNRSPHRVIIHKDTKGHQRYLLKLHFLVTKKKFRYIYKLD